jgi:hypothetical protein
LVQLSEYEAKPDGSFIQRLEQLNKPIEYSSEDGFLAGFWVTLTAEYVAESETLVRWRVNACFTGNPLDFSGFVNGALTNAISTFRDAGQLTGDSLGPYAVQSF